MQAQHVEATYLKNYKTPDFTVDHVHLHFDVQDDFTIVKSILHIQRKPSAPNVPLVLDGEELELQAIFLDEKALSEEDYTLTETHLTISAVPKQFILETHVKIFPKKNKKLMGLYQSRANLCTQCEAEGFRHITYYFDRPDVMSYFTTTITADKKQFPYLLSNGNLMEEKTLSDNRHWVRWEDPSKKPCYLFALVAGDFDLIQDTFTTMSKKKIDLYLYLEKGYRDQGDYAMVALKKSMKWDEVRFGREYDLNRFMIVAVSDFNMGAMENKGLNIFNTKYILAKPQTATDTDYVNIERVIGHEYFHNWSGNRITCREWFQLTLKEGLTVFRDQSFTEDMTSKGVARIDVVNTLRNHQFPEDAGPMAHPIRPDSYMKIDNFYTATVYEKGAEVIRMVQTLLTPEIFRKAMDLYFSRYDGQAVTTEDFLSAMSDASGRDLSQFSRWYHQAGTPVLRVKTHYDADKKTYDVIIKQSCPETPDQTDKLPLHLPFAIGLLGSNCTDLPLTSSKAKGSGSASDRETLLHSKSSEDQPNPVFTKILELTKPEQTFTFTNITEEPVPSLLRHFSAPVELQYDYTNEQLALLLQCDSDAFCRYEAGQRLLVNMIASIAKNMLFDKPYEVPTLLINTFQKLLTQKIADPNLFSRLLTFPSLKYLLSQIEKIDLTIIYDAKVFLEKALAVQLESHWLKLYKKYHLVGDYVYDAHACGYRRLKNLCLFYLLKVDHIEHVPLAYHQAISANNMTDQLAGLIAMNDRDLPQREEALSHFYAQYKDEPLVVNKWLSLCASTHLLQVTDDVKKLLRHPAFDQHNPNNVYALLVTFGENTIRFHDKNGLAYRLVADQVLAIDAFNPQVAVRVVQPLTQWKKMDAVRGVMMQSELKRMKESGKLSDNLFEIVSKSLV